MRRKKVQGIVKQFHVVSLVNPAAGSTRVRQGNDDAPAARVLDPVLASHDIAQRLNAKKSLDCESADRNDERRTNNAELVIQPIAAPRTLGGGRHAITSPTGMRAGVAPRHCGYIEVSPGGDFVETSLVQPLEQRRPSPAGKGTSAATLRLTRRLANEHRVWRAGERNNRDDVRRMRTSTTCGEAFPM